MPIGLQLLTSLVLALGAVYLVTPVAIRVATQLDFFDRPVGYKGHLSPTPYLGGAAVVAGFAVVLVPLSADWGRTVPLLAGVAVLWALGTVDDRRTVSPGLRVVVELVVAAGLWALGLGWSLGHGGAVDLAVTAFWLVAVINAFNFFDNMDGAASSLGSVIAAGLAVVGLVRGDVWLTVAAAALCGACLGFLPHNLLVSPARIFLGDGGSLPIGFAIGALVMIGTAGVAAEWQSLAIGVLLVGVPALDTTMVIVSRLRRHVPILTGGRDHMTHRTLDRVRTVRAVALVLGGAQALVSALAVLAVGAGSAAIPVVAALYVSAACVAVVVFGTRPREPLAVGSAAAGARAGAPRRGRSGGAVILVVIAAAAGVSPFFFAYYGAGWWAPAGLVLLALAAGVAVAAPVRLDPPRTLALVGLGGLAAVSLASSTWSPSAEQAMISGNRYVVLAALFALLVMLVRVWFDARLLLWVVTATGCATALVVLARLLGGDGSLFLAGRLHAPLGYINGEAAFLLLLVWPCLAAIEQRTSRLLTFAGAFAATALSGLAVLSQSRGAVIAMSVAIIVVVAAVPGRLRRVGLLIVVGGCLAPVVPLLLDVYQARAGGADGVGEMRRAAIALLLAAGIAGATAAALSGLLRPALASRLRPLLAGGLAIVALAATAAAFGYRGDIADRVSRQADTFRAVGVPTSGSSPDASRLASGAGNRYDYWRIAWGVWREHPVRGVGAGGYGVPYFQQRATGEDVRQPHSLALQTLSELGLLGGLLLATFVLAVGWGAWRTSRAAVASTEARALAVAGVGMFTAWLVQTSVDWLHLLPGVTAIALAGASVLFIAPATRPAQAAARRGSARLVPAVVVAVALVLAGISLSRQVLADQFREHGQAALAKDPATALRDADRSLRIVPEAIGSYRLKAAAFARFDQPAAARAVLQEALRREPEDFVTWALLGDLETRVGATGPAARAYRRAVELNPRNRELRTLLRDARGVARR